MTRPITIDNYMVKHPVTVKATDSVIAASRKILQYEISGVCVVDDNNNLVGVLSELDCLRAILERILENGEPTAGTVAEVMTTEVNTSDPDEQIINIASSMLEKKQRRRPVVVNGKLQGQVTCRQILKAIKDFANP